MINGEGFYKGHDFAWDANDMSIYEKSVISVLHRWAEGNSGIIEMSKVQIGKAAGGIDFRTVNKALKSLKKRKVRIAGVEYDMLEIIPVSINGKDLCTRYKLPPFHMRCSVDIQHKNPDKLGVHPMHPSEVRGTPDVPPSPTPDAPPRGTPHVPTGQQGQQGTTITGVGEDIIKELKKKKVDKTVAETLFTKYGDKICSHNLKWFTETVEIAKKLDTRKPGLGLLITAIKDDYSEARWKNFIESMEKKAEKEDKKKAKILNVVQLYEHSFDGKYFSEKGQFIGLFFKNSQTCYLPYDEQIEYLENYKKIIQFKGIYFVDNKKIIYKTKPFCDVYFIDGKKKKVKNLEGVKA